jgi:hypothetical protein
LKVHTRDFLAFKKGLDTPVSFIIAGTLITEILIVRAAIERELSRWIAMDSSHYCKKNKSFAQFGKYRHVKVPYTFIIDVFSRQYGRCIDLLST